MKQVEATKKAPYSVDENLYHTSYESGMLEDPMVAPLKEMFKMVRVRSVDSSL
jgi:argininosuccinate synthase